MHMCQLMRSSARVYVFVVWSMHLYRRFTFHSLTQRYLRLLHRKSTFRCWTRSSCQRRFCRQRQEHLFTTRLFKGEWLWGFPSLIFFSFVCKFIPGHSFRFRSIGKLTLCSNNKPSKETETREKKFTNNIKQLQNTDKQFPSRALLFLQLFASHCAARLPHRTHLHLSAQARPELHLPAQARGAEGDFGHPAARMVRIVGCCVVMIIYFCPLR